MSKNLPTTFEPIDQCLNCEHVLETQANYCLNCGSKIQEKRFTLRRIFEEVSQNIFSVDASIFKTFIDLFIRPEAVIGGYLAGLRKRYLNAFSYLTITILISGLQNILIKRFFPDLLDQLSQDANTKAFVDSAIDNWTLLFYASIPILALIAWLVFYTLRKHNFTEQAIVQIYTYSHVSLVISTVGTLFLMMGINYMWYVWGSQILYIIYNIYVYKRLYKLSASSLALRTLLFLAIMIGICILLLIFSFLVGIILAAVNPEFVKELFPQA